MHRQRVEHSGNLAGDSGAHEHNVHAGEHRSIERGEVRHLHFGEQVDPDRISMSFFGQPDFGESGQDCDLLARGTHHLLVHGQRLVRPPRRAPAREEIAPERRLRDRRIREVVHGAAQVSANIAILKSPHEDRVDHGARHDSQLAAQRYGARQQPVGDTGTHTALNDDWELVRARAFAVGHIVPIYQPIAQLM